LEATDGVDIGTGGDFGELADDGFEIVVGVLLHTHVGWQWEE